MDAEFRLMEALVEQLKKAEADRDSAIEKANAYLEWNNRLQAYVKRLENEAKENFYDCW